MANGTARPVFPNYTQLPTYLPLNAWHVLRGASLTAAIVIVYLLLVEPEQGLFVLWNIAVPLVPAVFLVAPGLWRNVCPLAALNQFPRLAGFNRGLEHTRAIREYSYIIGIVALFVLASMRKVLFNHDGTASAALILGALALALLGGIVFKGKSGWCSSICPLLPVQRLYGQSPFVTIANAHCRPCVGCTKNCYDFNPAVANLADQYDQDRHYVGYRRFFAAVFPGFLLGFYLQAEPPAIPVERMYLGFAGYMGASLAVFATLDTFAKVRANALVVLFAAAAFNIYYWFAAELLVGSAGKLLQAAPGEPWVWGIRTVVLGVTVVWIFRALRVERRFLAHSVATASAPAARLGGGAAAALQRQARKETVQVTFRSLEQPAEEKRFAVQPGQTVLAVAEQSGLSIEAGCRMGVCGADPVAVLEGMEHLSACGEDEKATLDRLGFAGNTRMACCARISGPVAISLAPERRATPPADAPAARRFDPAIRHVVIVGNGIAGVTAAEHVRKRHPECEIALIGREKFPLYNRMGITRLVYGRSAMQGLYLLPDAWYDEQRISSWLNTRAERIDLAGRVVVLGTGEALPYDRLILATGSASFVPQVAGFGAAGSFVLRDAEDAMRIRAYAQERRARTAVVAGGGLLGVEAAYALLKLGLRVTVLERGRWPLQRQIDERAGTLLRDYLSGLGMQVLVESEVDRLDAPDGALKTAVLKDGRVLPSDVALLCAGIRPNVELARAAGLTVNRGVVVDAHMRTSAHDVYCVGDAAEFEGQVYGLWPACVEQGAIAAANAMGEQRTYSGTTPATILKVVGADLSSIGRTAPAATDEVITFEDAKTRRYAKLILADGRIAGAIMMGFPNESALVTNALKRGIDVSGKAEALRRGEWRVLEHAAG